MQSHRFGESNSVNCFSTLRAPLLDTRRVVGLLSAGLGVAGALIVLALTHRGGPGITVDSVNYLSAAESLTTNARFRGFLPGDDLAVFPPLYPLLLVPGDALGTPLSGARIVGVLVFAGLVAAGVLGAARIGRSAVYPAAMGTALLLSYPLAGVSSFVWSDAPFALAVALFLLTVSGIGTRRHAVAASGLLAGIATLTRYLGVTTIPVGLLAVALWSRRRSRDVPLFLVLAAPGPLLWIARNLVVSSTPAGERYAAAEGLGAAVRDTVRTIGTWLQPDRPAVGLAVATVVAVAAISTKHRFRPSRLEAAALAFSTLYVIWLVVSAATVALDPIDDRFLAPIYLPLAWLAVGAFRRLSAIAVERVARVALLVALVGIASLWAVFQAPRIPALVDVVERSSLSRFPRWDAKDEERARQMSPLLYSNAPDVVYLRTGSRVSFSPRRAAYRSEEKLDELARLRDRLATEGPAVLIWFGDVVRPPLYTPAELGDDFELRTVASPPGATIYLLRSPGRDFRMG